MATVVNVGPCEHGVIDDVCITCTLAKAVVVGDAIRFSVGLLRHMHDEPEHTSVLVKVAEVRTEDDGSKILVLERL